MKNHQTQEERHEMLVNGLIETVIPKLAIPTIISMMVSSIYNTADTFFVSQIGTSASGAVGIIFSAMSIIQALSFMVGMGSGNFMTRSIGAGKRKLAEHIVSIAFFTGALIGLVIAALGVLNLHAVVMFLGATETIAPYAEDYAFYIFLAAPFMTCSFIMNNLLRFQGKAFFAMFGITIGGLLNIALDPLFIFTLGMGTGGAALATGLSQFISFCILLFMCNFRKDCISIRLRNFKPTLAIYRQILYGGFPSLGRQGITSVATILMNVMAHPYGDAAIAAMSIVNRFMQFINSAIIGFGQGFQPVCSYCFGAKLYSRVKEACWFCIKVSTVVLVVFCLLGFLASGEIIALFRRDDPAVIQIGTAALRFQLITLPLQGVITIGNMFPQSIGYGLRATLVSTARQGLFLIPALLILTPALGILGLEISQPLADAATFLLAAAVIRGIIQEITKNKPAS